MEGTGNHHREYEGFSSVIGPEADQHEAYERMNIDALVDKVIDGFHATILAYGQTGSGKTHTVMGGKQLDGLIPQAILTLYEKLRDPVYGGNWNVRASMVEVGNTIGVVNECITDLLDTSKVERSSTERVMS